MLTLDIPAARLAPAQALVTRHARKAARLGMPAPALTVTREYQRIWIDQRNGGGPYEALPLPFLPETRVRVLDMVEIQVTGERPVIAGWRFAAVIEATEVGNLLRKHPAHVGDLPLRFRDCASECEHCHTNRRRAETFVVEELHDGVTYKAARYVQVGRSCLGDFTGNADPAVWLACYQWLRELEVLCEDDGLGGWGSSAPAIGTTNFLTCVAAHSRLYGYVSASMARDRDLAATGSEVMHLLSSTQREARRAARALAEAVIDADRTIVERALAWLASPEAGESEYIHNLRIHAAGSCVRARGANMLASLIASYRKHVGETVSRGREQKANEHLPVAVKGRVDGLLVTLVREAGYETDYGWTSIYTFEDADGRAVKWRTGQRLRDDVEIGTRVVLSGIVKAHGEYKGRRETELTRCVVELWAASDESVETCTALHGKRSAKCPAQKLGKREVVYLHPGLLDTEVFANEAPTCDEIDDSTPTNPFAAFECAA